MALSGHSSRESLNFVSSRSNIVAIHHSLIASDFAWVLVIVIFSVRLGLWSFSFIK